MEDMDECCCVWMEDITRVRAMSELFRNVDCDEMLG